jgi:hypothetical protein
MLENGMYRARSCFSPDAIVGAAMRCLVPSPAAVGLAIVALSDSVHAEPDASPVSLSHRMPGLFRKEVLEARQAAVFGQVVLRTPLSFKIWCAAAAATVAALVVLLVFGQYTKRARIHGITVPAAGVLKLAASQPGIVIERHVEEGQPVRAGEVLFVVWSERMTETAGRSAGAQTAVLEQLGRRRARARGGSVAP